MEAINFNPDFLSVLQLIPSISLEHGPIYTLFTWIWIPGIILSADYSHQNGNYGHPGVNRIWTVQQLLSKIELIFHHPSSTSG